MEVNLCLQCFGWHLIRSFFCTQIEILKAGSETLLVTLSDVQPNATIADVKNLVFHQSKIDVLSTVHLFILICVFLSERSLYPERISLRSESSKFVLLFAHYIDLQIFRGQIVRWQSYAQHFEFESWKSFVFQRFGPTNWLENRVPCWICWTIIRVYDHLSKAICTVWR